MASSFVFSVGMEYTGALFLLLLIAMILSLIILIAEIMSFKFKQRTKEQKLHLNSKEVTIQKENKSSSKY